MNKLENNYLSCDIFIAGGGPAGVNCAIAAARSGSKVILCQDRSVLGGNASSEVRMHIVGADSNGYRTKYMETEARETGIIEEIRLDTCVRNPQRSPSMLDLVLYEKCRAEENLQLFLNTAVVGVELKDGRITSAIAERQSTEDRFIIEADIFIDCTGDGRMAFEAGAEFRHGREGKEEFDETLGQEKPDKKTLGSTILFMASKYDQPMPFIPPTWARKFTEDDLKYRPHATEKRDRGLEYGYWWAEWGGQLDTIKDNELIRDELLSIVMGIWDHIKNGGDHGAANWALDWFGFLPGKRESRRFKGLYTLSQEDLIQSKKFDDAIGYGGWPIDSHPPEGIDKKDSKPGSLRIALEHLYDIPLRSFISKDIPNLMFAGRNMSATHIAFASTRVMATCAVTGQGVGTSASFAVRHKIDPGEIVRNQDYMKSVQQRLLRDDCYLIGVNNEDKFDLARLSKITASSEQDEGKAVNIISGQTRSVHGEGGAPPGRYILGSNRWMSNPKAGLPASISLNWDNPIKLKEIQIIFDTGLHRLLTLSHSKNYSPTMVWGSPQPETVKSYNIKALIDGKWTEIISVDNNWQRLRRHVLDADIETMSVELDILSTNGMDHARIYEIRVYGK